MTTKYRERESSQSYSERERDEDDQQETRGRIVGTDQILTSSREGNDSKQADHDEKSSRQEGHDEKSDRGDNDRKSSSHRGDDSKQAGHQNEHDERDEKLSQFRYNHEGIEPRADYAELVASNMKTLGERKRSGGAREEWADAAKSYEAGDTLMTDNHGRGPFGIFKSKMRKHVEHVTESFADVSQTLEWDPSRRREAAYHVTDRMLSKQMGQTEYAEAQSAYKSESGSSSYAQYLTDQEKQTLLDFHNKTVHCMERAADPSEKYSHKDAAKDIADTLEKATRYLQHKNVIDTDGNLTKERQLQFENDTLRQENQLLRDAIKNGNYFEASLDEKSNNERFRERYANDPTSGEDVNHWGNGWSKEPALAYEGGYTAAQELFARDNVANDDTRRQVYSEQFLNMMSGNTQEHISEFDAKHGITATEHGTRFMEKVSQATYLSHEERLQKVLAQGDEKNEAGLTGPEAYAQMREELRQANDSFLKIRNEDHQPTFNHKEFEHDDRIAALIGEGALPASQISDKGVSEVSKGLLEQAANYAKDGDHQMAMEYLDTFDQIVNQYQEPVQEGKKSPAQNWKDSVEDVKEMFPLGEEENERTSYHNAHQKQEA